MNERKDAIRDARTLGVPKMLLLGLQHMFAMFGATILVPILVNSYFDPAVKLIYAAGALCGLIGAIRVYSKFSSGDPDTGKTAGSWFGACVFLIVAATVLRSFFL
jgi:hypothetical protein